MTVTVVKYQCPFLQKVCKVRSLRLRSYVLGAASRREKYLKQVSIVIRLLKCKSVM